MDAYGSHATAAPSATAPRHEKEIQRESVNTPSSGRKFWHLHFLCATALIVTDYAAFALSLSIESIVSSQNIYYLERNFVIPYVLFFIMVGYFIYRRHYNDRLPFWSESAQVVGASIMAECAFIILSWPNQPPASALIPFVAFPFIDLTMRQFTKRLLHQMELWRIPVLLVGEPESCARAIEIFSSERFPGLRSVGCIPTSALLEISEHHHHHRLLDGYGAARLLLVINSHDQNWQDIVEHITRIRLPFSIMPPFAGLPLDHGCHSYFSHDGMVMTFRSNLERPLYRLAKIGLDLCVAFLVLLVILPVMAIIYTLIRLDGGPAIFGHERIGRDGRVFRCLKFRTMVVNADSALADLLAKDPQAAAEWEATRKLTSDPRITRIGQILRKTSLDELPQILNVLKMDMSLVGPRPIVLAERVHYGKDIAYYMATRPGITGLWQISGRSDTSYERRVQLDNWYVRNWSIWRDIVIIVRTVPAVLTRKGAR